MRAGVRKQILEKVPSLLDCYEPNVPTYDTQKPYGVVVQGSDTSRQDPTSFQRTIEVWIYNDMETFKTLDTLTLEVIEALDLQTFTDPDTLLSYTAKFNGTTGQDIVDQDWKATIRGLQFSVISLHESKASNNAWEKATADFIESIENIKAYQGTWRENFQVPSVLCRTISKSNEGINYMSYRENREMRIHVVSKDNAEINRIIDKIEYELMKAIKIPLDLANRRYLTISSIRENRASDMLGVGQVTVGMTRINGIDRDVGYINKIQGRHVGGLDYDERD